MGGILAAMKKLAGYTLTEAVIAGAILLVGITAAALLANSLVLAQEGNERVIRAYNIQDQAAKLYALGLSPTTITNILPANCVTNSPAEGELIMNYGTATQVIGGMSVEVATNTMVFLAGQELGGTPTYRTNTVIVVRPATR